MTPDDLMEWIFKRNEIEYVQKGKGDKWGMTWDGVLNYRARQLGIDLKNANENQINQIYKKIIEGVSHTFGVDKRKLGRNFYDFFKSKISSSDLDNLRRVLEKYRMTN